jgi:hypothetical protein
MKNGGHVNAYSISAIRPDCGQYRLERRAVQPLGADKRAEGAWTSAGVDIIGDEARYSAKGPLTTPACRPRIGKKPNW